ncbi:Panacea domain-containing protein [Porphyromonas cangingivalis]|nr:Panacea domain-containing protein [Porphyromonas cangingivalis]
MNNLEQYSLIEMSLYILQKTGGLDIYHLLKTLYFAQRHHLATYGMPLVADEFHALKYGPIPTHLYDLYKHKNSSFNCVIGSENEDAQGILFARREPDMDYLSIADIETLDYSIRMYSSKTFQELKELSHDEYWERAFNNPSNHIMSHVDIANSGGAPSGVVELINEHNSIKNALS